MGTPRGVRVGGAHAGATGVPCHKQSSGSDRRLAMTLGGLSTPHLADARRATARESSPCRRRGSRTPRFRALPCRSVRQRGVGAIVVALLCALAGVALPASAGAQTPARDVLFVGNSNDGTIDLFDAHTLTRIGGFSAIPDGNTPQDPFQAALYEPLISKVGI